MGPTVKPNSEANKVSSSAHDAIMLQQILQHWFQLFHWST
jgi:hypothetical protein